MNKRKVLVGLGLGTVAGGLDIIPMLIQKLSWDANLSAFTFWILAGFLIATSNLKLPAPVKGFFIAFITIIPTAIIIFAQDPVSLIPMSIATLVLGGLLGFLIEKLGGSEF